MWPDRVSNPGPPTYESDALPIALRGPAQPTQTDVSNGTTTPQGKHLCKLILKSMHKCRINCQDKLGL